MAKDSSLWPEFEKVDIVLPKKILEEQAAIFNSNMKGVLECQITSREKPDDVWMPALIGDSEDTKGREQQVLMHIVAPKVGGYRMTVLIVTFTVTQVYPCQIKDCMTETTYSVKNSEEFKSELKKILSSEVLGKAVAVLRSQSE